MRITASGLGMLIFLIVILLILITIMQSSGLDTGILEEYLKWSFLIFIVLILLGFIKGGRVNAIFE